jgi:hypothetical protein
MRLRFHRTRSSGIPASLRVSVPDLQPALAAGAGLLEPTEGHLAGGQRHARTFPAQGYGARVSNLQYCMISAARAR